jgi:hypothetical protein
MSIAHSMTFCVWIDFFPCRWSFLELHKDHMPQRITHASSLLHKVVSKRTWAHVLGCKNGSLTWVSSFTYCQNLLAKVHSISAWKGGFRLGTTYLACMQLLNMSMMEIWCAREEVINNPSPKHMNFRWHTNLQKNFPHWIIICKGRRRMIALIVSHLLTKTVPPPPLTGQDYLKVHPGPHMSFG